MNEEQIVLSKQGLFFDVEKTVLNFTKKDIKLLYDIYKRNQFDFKNIILKQYDYQNLDETINKLQIKLNEVNEQLDITGRTIDDIMDKYDK